MWLPGKVKEIEIWRLASVIIKGQSNHESPAEKKKEKEKNSRLCQAVVRERCEDGRMSKRCSVPVLKVEEGTH